MSRPYSATKASKIKARRELEDEVAGVQAGAADWNNTNEGMVTTRSGRNTISTPNTGRKLVSYPPTAWPHVHTRPDEFTGAEVTRIGRA